LDLAGLLVRPTQPIHISAMIQHDVEMRDRKRKATSACEET
jgi:hypothetical protein